MFALVCKPRSANNKAAHLTQKRGFIFNIDTASELPYFTYTTSNLQLCPYLPILVDTATLAAEKNVLGVESGPRRYR